MSTVERGFLTILATIAERNTAHLEFQERSRHLLTDKPEGMPGHIVESAVGQDITMRLKQLTEHLQSDAPRARDDLLAMANQLHDVLDLHFPTGGILQFEPTAVSKRSVVSPVNARRAEWWRRLVRWTVNKWRRPKLG
jgi:hypothetical protein